MTTISWTDETWNPVTGCTKVSPGCAHCYAESVTRRFKDRMQPSSDAFIPWTVKAQRESGIPAVTLHPERLDQPLHWKKPRCIFVNSMSDLFHEDVPDEFIDQVFAVMALAPQHTFQVLTKRPERMRNYLTDENPLVRLHHTAAGDVTGSLAERFRKYGNIYSLYLDASMPLSNVWLGVSVENQRYANERILPLLQTPAAVRFISAEPLLGPVDLDQYLAPRCPSCRVCHLGNCDAPKPVLLNWVIAGCESGQRHRPMETDWARDLRDQCQAANVPFFLKQMYVDGKKVETPELDGRTWKEFPQRVSA